MNPIAFFRNLSLPLKVPYAGAFLLAVPGFLFWQTLIAAAGLCIASIGLMIVLNLFDSLNVIRRATSRSLMTFGVQGAGPKIPKWATSGWYLRLCGVVGVAVGCGWMSIVFTQSN